MSDEHTAEAAVANASKAGGGPHTDAEFESTACINFIANWYSEGGYILPNGSMYDSTGTYQDYLQDFFPQVQGEGQAHIGGYVTGTDVTLIDPSLPNYDYFFT